MDSDSSTGWRFQWDEVKNLANIKSMVWTLSMWRRCFAVYSSWNPDGREEYGESRWIGVGAIRGRVAYVVFTRRGPETIRIISLRKASRSERKEYEKAIQNRLETD
jgi:uncharacterized DUF497 family protein